MSIRILVYIALTLGVINLIINIFVISRIRFNEYRMKNQTIQEPKKEGIVFCKKCNNRFSAALQKCPSCGAPRR